MNAFHGLNGTLTFCQIKVVSWVNATPAFLGYARMTYVFSGNRLPIVFFVSFKSFYLRSLAFSYSLSSLSPILQVHLFAAKNSAPMLIDIRDSSVFHNPKEGPPIRSLLFLVWLSFFLQLPLL